MPYRATGIEWLALGAIAQQPDGSLRSHSLRVYLRETLGVARPLSLVQSLIKGGLVEYIGDEQRLVLTEWGACSQRAMDAVALPHWLPIPANMVNARQGKRL